MQSLVSLDTFEPCDLGLPGKFQEFRKEQLEAVETALNSSARVDGFAIPTGGGKSLTAVAIAKATGLRGVILTATKGLQDQYGSDFEECGMVDVRGRSNYLCAHDGSSNCRFGFLEGCNRKKTCTATVAGARARKSNLVITNYSYWIASCGMSVNRGIDDSEEDDETFPKEVELLVLDEGHRAMEELSKAMKVELREKQLTEFRLDHQTSDDIHYWVDWANSNGPDITNARIEAVVKYKRTRDHKSKELAKKLIALEEQVDKVAGMLSDNWTVEMQQGTRYGRVWSFDCVWPGALAESVLFRGVRKIIILSATLRPITLKMLGLEPDQYTFKEWPRIFPPHRSPVYHYAPSPSVRLNHKISDEGLKHWVERIDGIIDSRKDTKGIIHTVSYARQQYLQLHSRHSGSFLCNTNNPDSESAADVVRTFKQADAPAILVSPSFSTGWDFPDAECRWQIIAKVPYPDIRSKVMQARCLRNKQYANNLTMQDLVQSCGRPMRHHKDWCETFIVDDTITFFLLQNKHLAPFWFEINKVITLPKPLNLVA